MFNAPKADAIVGGIGIIAANSMCGELSPRMARAIAESPARKILIPLNRCGIFVMGTTGKPLLHYIDEAVGMLRDLLEEESRRGSPVKPAGKSGI